MKRANLIKKLECMGWVRYMNDDYNWQCKNRYVGIEFPYINIYVFAEQEKWKSYLTVAEFDLFNKLMKKLK